MRSLFLAVSLAAATPALTVGLTGCSYTKRVKFLSDTEFDHYYAMRVYLDEDERKEYLKLKTEEERNTYLQSYMLPGRPPKSLWDTFYQYDEDERADIVAGAVEEGWTIDKLMMAWGRPMKSRKVSGRKAQRSLLFLYKFEKHYDGSVLVWKPGSKTEYKAERLFVREVILDDDVIAEINDK